jgi:hypothetical protein
MAAALLYPDLDLRLGADGEVPAGALSDDGCCGDALCVPFCATACSFLDLLPSGPLWDLQKAEAVQALTAGDGEPCDPDGYEPKDCPSMADYAVYGARVLHEMVQTILWPVIREASPVTAHSSVDDWLERFAWEDCYRQICTFAGQGAPYSYLGACGPTLCPPEFTTEFEEALKHAIIVSLNRARHGVIKNLAGINWVIAPLGAAVAPRMPWPTDVQALVNGDCQQDDPPCFCDEAALEICQTSELFPAAPGPRSHCEPPAAPLSASQVFICDGEERLVYPGVIAADCIVRSLLTRKCPSILTRCEPSIAINPPAPPEL